jgi:hypothetical protein
VRRSLYLLAPAALLAFGCDAEVMVQGRVYRRIDPPASARGQVLIDAPQSRLPPHIEPLAGAKVTLYFSAEGARLLDPKDRAWNDPEVSEADGSFTADGACAGGTYEMALTVQREGCLPLVQRFTYRYEHPDYEMAVLLVCPQVK